LNDNVRPGWQESDRLAALRSYRILDTPPDAAFDDVVQLAARVCQAPMAAIVLIDERRQWFKAEVGLGLRETPLEASICAQVMLQPGISIVPDLTRDSRFDCNPLVTGNPHLRFYAGVLLETPDRFPIGSLCVLDHVPRGLTEDQAFTLGTLAREVMSHFELRRAVIERDEALSASRATEQRHALLVRELHHRVRNSLAMVQAMLGATARTTGSVAEFYRSFSARIGSLAKTQTLLTEDYWQTAPLRELVLKELRPFEEDGKQRFVAKGPRLDLAADLAVPIGMALHELTTNAAKFGALSSPDGTVEVVWELRADQGARRVRLEWRERDGPPVRAPEREGFGSSMLRKVLPMQTKADVQLAFEPSGVTCRIEAPLIEQRLVPHY